MLSVVRYYILKIVKIFNNKFVLKNEEERVSYFKNNI